MPAVSERQRKAMAIAEHHPEKLYRRNRAMLKMSRRQLSEFASTKDHVRKLAKLRLERKKKKRKV